MSAMEPVALGWKNFGCIKLILSGEMDWRLWIIGCIRVVWVIGIHGITILSILPMAGLRLVPHEGRGLALKESLHILLRCMDDRDCKPGGT